MTGQQVVRIRSDSLRKPDQIWHNSRLILVESCVMQLYRLSTLPDALPDRFAVTIGNFDGVHLGHQAMLRTLQQQAAALNLATMAMIFEPQPQEFFNPDNPPPRITSLREKLMLLRAAGLDAVTVVRFDQSFRALSAQQFVDLLRYRLNAQALVIGDDFRFGNDRKGDYAFLQQAGFPLAALETVEIDGVRVSSTRIRQVLAQGDFPMAERLLGRPYAITGHIQYGDQIGRTLNFPTANVALNRLTPCLQGIYGVDMVILRDNGRLLPDWQQTALAGQLPDSVFGAAHIGTRPAIRDPRGKVWRLEVHVLPDGDAPFAPDLYGCLAQVTFRYASHGVRDYPSLPALEAGIRQDVLDLRQWHQTQQQRS